MTKGLQRTPSLGDSLPGSPSFSQPTSSDHESSGTDTDTGRGPVSDQGILGNSAVASAMTPQGDLSADAEERAVQLRDAVVSGDMRTIYMVLGGPDNTAEKDAYRKAIGLPVESSMKIWLRGSDLMYGLSFARFGKADIKCRIHAVSIDILGTEEERLFEILEGATMDERYALAQDREVIRWLWSELSGADFQRAFAPLAPFVGQVADDAAKAALFAKVEQSENELGTAAEALLTKLKSHKGFLNDDEEGMIGECEAFAKEHGKIDVSDPAMSAVMGFLSSELNDKEYSKARSTLTSGGQRTLLDKINEADNHKTMWLFHNTDEDAICQAIAATPLAERKAFLDNEAAMKRLREVLEGDDLQHAMTLLNGQDTAADHAALHDLHDELDSWLWVSDHKVFEALERMSAPALVRLRENEALRKDIEGGLSDANITIFHQTIGYTGAGRAEGKSVEDAAAELEGSNARVVARIEEAVDHWDDDEDKVYDAVVEWQRAGGKMTRAEHGPLLDRAWAALRDLDVGRSKEIYEALLGLGTVGQLGRLRSAVQGLGTDDAGLEAAIADVTDEELIRSWSNLSAHKAAWLSAPDDESKAAVTEGFVPDLTNDVKSLIKGDRDDWLEQVGELRDKLVAALKTPAGAAIAANEFNFTMNGRHALRMEYAHSRQLADHDRGDGMWNAMSMGIVDSMSGTGTETEWAFGTYQGQARDALAQKDNSAAEATALAATDTAHDEYIESHENYKEAKASISNMGGAIVQAIVFTVITVATAGTAGPALASFMAFVGSAGLQELTEKAILGEDYSVEQGAIDMTQAIINGVLFAGTGKVVDMITKGAGQLPIFQTLNESLTAKLPGIAEYMGGEAKQLLTLAIRDIPRNYTSELLNTEGVLRDGVAGALPALNKTLQSYASGMVVRGLNHAVNNEATKLEELRKTSTWDELPRTLVKQGIINTAIGVTVSRLVSGDELDASDLVNIMGWLTRSVHGATLSAKTIRTDAEKSLKFFNEASKEELQKVHGIGPGISGRLIEARNQQGGFKSLRAIAEVPYFKEEVLFANAGAIRDAFVKEQEEKAGVTTTGASQS